MNRRVRLERLLGPDADELSCERCFDRPRVRHGANGDAVQFLHVVLRPDFGAQQAQAHLHQAMVQVDEHDVVAATGDGVVESDSVPWKAEQEPLSLRTNCREDAATVVRGLPAPLARGPA